MATRPRTLTRAEVRELDRRAIEECGIPALALMENAGAACATEAMRMLDGATGPVLVLAGPGNNGGDGLVIARLLHREGCDVRTVFVGPVEKLDAASDEVQVNRELLWEVGLRLEVHEEAEDWETLLGAEDPPRLVVDALFGTGLSRPLREPWLGVVRAVRRLREAGARVLAVDLPSGLDADTGEELGEAIRADVTVTFVAAKPGFRLAQGPACVGRVEVVPIGIPVELLDG